MLMRISFGAAFWSGPSISSESLEAENSSQCVWALFALDISLTAEDLHTQGQQNMIPRVLHENPHYQRDVSS